MCTSCWIAAGAPKETGPHINKAARLIAAVYAQPNGGVGGNLHIVVDDFNIERYHIERCLDDGLTAIEKECALYLLDMPFRTRAAALQFYDYPESIL